MTEAQVKLFQMYMRENQKLGVQLDIALEALSKCADNKLLSAIVNKALVEIIKIGETTKGGNNEWENQSRIKRTNQNNEP